MNKKLIPFALCALVLFPFCAMATQTHASASTTKTTAAPYSPLRFQILGITDPHADKNATIAIQNLRNSLVFPFTEQEIKHFYKKAPKVIQQALMPYGYFKSQVQGTLNKKDRFWIASFQVNPGPTLPVSSIQIKIQGPGSTDPEFIKWQHHLPLHPGSPLNTLVYENIKTRLRNLATRRGYFDFQLQKSQIQIDLAHYAAHIIIICSTGSRYRYGETIFSKTLLHEKFLRRFIQYHQGDYYDAYQLEKTQDGFIASNFFSQVIIKPDLKKASHQVVPISVNLITRKAKEYTLGAGYGSDTGVRGTLGIILRNIGHNGHRFHTLIRASENNSSLVAKYLIPGFDPARDLFSIGAGIGTIEQATGNARNAKFGITYTVSRSRWKHSLTLAYLTERYNLKNLPNTSTMLVFPTWESEYLKLDRKKNPNNGIRFNTQLTGASKDVLSQTNFFQATAKLATLNTISSTHTRFLSRTSVGHTNINNLTELPLSLQLFAGGSHSMRGFGYNSVGPGRNLAVVSTELQQRLYGNLYLAAFVDAGVVANQNLFQHINADAGPGIVWITSIGAIQLTAAEAFTQSNKPWTLQFAMGTFL
jgi:translocation and assembly module TamA